MIVPRYDLEVSSPILNAEVPCRQRNAPTEAGKKEKQEAGSPLLYLGGDRFGRKH
jgi:hypothetical protein